MSALNSLIGCLDFVWIGWPGIPVDASSENDMKCELLLKFNCIPVFLAEDTASRYYNGFANGYSSSLIVVCCGPHFTMSQEMSNIRSWIGIHTKKQIWLS